MTFALGLIVLVNASLSVSFVPDFSARSLDEMRKLIVRNYPRSFVAWLAW